MYLQKQTKASIYLYELDILYQQLILLTDHMNQNDQLLQCPLCSLQFNQKERLPKNFCINQHIACSQCVQMLWKDSNKQTQTVGCPLCRRPVKYKDITPCRYIKDIIQKKQIMRVNRSMLRKEKNSLDNERKEMEEKVKFFKRVESLIYQNQQFAEKSINQMKYLMENFLKYQNQVLIKMKDQRKSESNEIRETIRKLEAVICQKARETNQQQVKDKKERIQFQKEINNKMEKLLSFISEQQRRKKQVQQKQKKFGEQKQKLESRKRQMKQKQQKLNRQTEGTLKTKNQMDLKYEKMLEQKKIFQINKQQLMQKQQKMLLQMQKCLKVNKQLIQKQRKMFEQTKNVEKNKKQEYQKMNYNYEKKLILQNKKQIQLQYKILSEQKLPILKINSNNSSLIQKQKVLIQIAIKEKIKKKNQINQIQPEEPSDLRPYRMSANLKSTLSLQQLISNNDSKDPFHQQIIKSEKSNQNIYKKDRKSMHFVNQANLNKLNQSRTLFTTCQEQKVYKLMEKIDSKYQIMYRHMDIKKGQIYKFIDRNIHLTDDEILQNFKFQMLKF